MALILYEDFQYLIKIIVIMNEKLVDITPHGISTKNIQVVNTF